MNGLETKQKKSSLEPGNLSVRRATGRVTCITHTPRLETGYTLFCHINGWAGLKCVRRNQRSTDHARRGGGRFDDHKAIHYWAVAFRRGVAKAGAQG